VFGNSAYAMQDFLFGADWPVDSLPGFPNRIEPNPLRSNSFGWQFILSVYG